VSTARRRFPARRTSAARTGTTSSSSSRPTGTARGRIRRCRSSPVPSATRISRTSPNGIPASASPWNCPDAGSAPARRPAMNFSRRAGARPRGPRTALVLVLAPIAMPAQAEVSRLEPVTVSVTRVEKAIEDVPAAVGAVGADEIQLGAEQLGLDESLDRIPGLFFLNRYNFAQDLRASIRGFGARANFGIRGIKIIVDGIPETLPDGQGSVDGIDLGSARQVSVIRGPASSLYGNASGGAIIVESERGPSVPFAELRAATGHYDYDKLQVKAGGETGRLNYLVNVSDTTLDGYRDHSESENRQLNGRFEFALSDVSRLLLTAHYTDPPLANDPGALTAEEVAADRTAA